VNQAVNKLSVLRLVLLPPILLLSLSIACIASAGGVGQQVCDVDAGYFLGVSKPSDTNADHICRHPKYGGNRRNQAESKYHGRISSK
jgi:hypothetical protein